MRAVGLAVRRGDLNTGLTGVRIVRTDAMRLSRRRFSLRDDVSDGRTGGLGHGFRFPEE